MATGIPVAFFMRLSLFLLGMTSLLSSCKQENNELTGHWVSTEYFEGKDFITIDFKAITDNSFYSDKDTIYYHISFNKNSLSTGGGYEHSLWKTNSGYGFCNPHCDASSTLSFKDDTLFIRGQAYKTFDGDFVKIDEQKSIYAELFNQTGIIGKLPALKTGDSILNLNRTFISNLNIGKSKLDSSESDSVRINVWDVYITLEEIPRFVSRQKEALQETDRQKLKIIINADSSVSEEYLNRVIGQVKKADSTLKMYQSIFDYKMNKIYYRSLE